MEEILERQLLIRGRAFATFATINKALAGREKSFRWAGHSAQGCTTATGPISSKPFLLYCISVASRVIRTKGMLYSTKTKHEFYLSIFSLADVRYANKFNKD